MKTKLIPPDRKQCQAERREGTFMSLGGSPHFLKRCTAKPVVIAKETKPAADGQIGSMSLCATCKAAMIEQCGEDYATFTRLP